MALGFFDFFARHGASLPAVFLVLLSPPDLRGLELSERVKRSLVDLLYGIPGLNLDSPRISGT